jgi:hypothetical protein
MIDVQTMSACHLAARWPEEELKDSLTLNRFAIAPRRLETPLACGGYSVAHERCCYWTTGRCCRGAHDST